MARGTPQFALQNAQSVLCVFVMIGAPLEVKNMLVWPLRFRTDHWAQKILCVA